MQNDLISRSALLEHIKDVPTWNQMESGWMSPTRYPEGEYDPEDVISSIENAPTVDAVELTEEEAVLLFSVATQIVQDMEVQGRASLYPRKYATFQEIKRKLREHIGERRAEGGK